MHIARFHPVKDHRTLVQGFAKMAADVTGVDLVLVGDGPERAAIEGLVAELGLTGRVHFLGVRRDVPVVLRAAVTLEPDIIVASGDFTPRAFCPGFLRGLAFHNNHAVIGLSLSRDGSFSGLALDDEMKKRDADGCCGVQIVNLGSDDIVQWIRIKGAVSELYDVAVLPGVRRPMAASFAGPEINDPVTFEV